MDVFAVDMRGELLNSQVLIFNERQPILTQITRSDTLGLLSIKDGDSDLGRRTDTLMSLDIERNKNKAKVQRELGGLVSIELEVLMQSRRIIRLKSKEDLELEHLLPSMLTGLELLLVRAVLLIPLEFDGEDLVQEPAELLDVVGGGVAEELVGELGEVRGADHLTRLGVVDAAEVGGTDGVLREGVGELGGVFAGRDGELDIQLGVDNGEEVLKLLGWDEENGGRETWVRAEHVETG